jgi:hypothetical protein
MSKAVSFFKKLSNFSVDLTDQIANVKEEMTQLANCPNRHVITEVGTKR